MATYFTSGKEILKVLINNGFEAYFIGEAVRNTITNKPVTRIDITTSAHVDAIKTIFKGYRIDDISTDSVKLTYSEYDFYLQTFMTGDGIDTNTIQNKHYSKNLLDDLANRDYTINAIAMSHSGKLTDAYDGYQDIMKKRIVHIGNSKIRYSKDPSLIIKAFALMSELNYKLSKKTRRAIEKKRKCLEQADIETWYPYLKQVFEGKYAKKSIYEMVRTNVTRVLPSLKKAFNRLYDHYTQITIEELLLMAFVNDGVIDTKYQSLIEDYEIFMKIFTLAVANKKGDYSNEDLFENGFEVSIEANRINHLLRKAKKKDKRIHKRFELLPIKNVSELNYSSDDLKNIIYEKDYHIIDEILMITCKKVVRNEVRNNKDDLEIVILDLLRQNNIYYNLNGIDRYSDNNILEEAKTDELSEKSFNQVSVDNFNPEVMDIQTNHRLDMLEQKIEEQNRLLRENDLRLQDMRNMKMQNDIDIVTSKTMEYLNANDSLKYIIKDQGKFKEKMKHFVLDYIKEEEKTND